MPKSDIPKHIVENFGSARAFRAYSRKHLRLALDAIKMARRGCAYHPLGTFPITKSTKLITEALRACSVKKWGR